MTSVHGAYQGLAVQFQQSTQCKVGRGNSGHGVIRATSTSGQR